MESEMKLSFLIFLITSVFEIIVTMLYFLFGFVRFFFFLLIKMKIFLWRGASDILL